MSEVFWENWKKRKQPLMPGTEDIRSGNIIRVKGVTALFDDPALTLSTVQSFSWDEHGLAFIVLEANDTWVRVLDDEAHVYFIERHRVFHVSRVDD